MALKINLLPEDHVKDKKAKRISRIVRTGTLAILALFILIGGAEAGILYYLSQQLDDLAQEQSNIKLSIANLESTEQNLVLIKDRVQKIQELLNNRPDEEIISKQKLITNALLTNLSVKSIVIRPPDYNIEITAASSLSVADLFQELSQKPGFDSLVLETTSFNPYEGYVLNLKF